MSKIITITAIIGLTIIGFVIGIIRYQGVYASTDGKPVTAAAIRMESLSAYEKSGDKISDKEIRANKIAIDRFIQRDTDHRFVGTLKFAYADDGKNLTLETRIDVSYNKEEKTYTFILSTTGNKDERFNGMWIEDGTYSVIMEKDGKTYFEANGTRTEADENNAVYKYLKYYRMGNLLYTGFLDDKETARYGLWDGAYYGRSYDSAGYAVFKDPGAELRTYHNKPVTYRYCYKDPNTGIERLFELDFEYKAPPDYTAAMNKIRKAKYLTIKDNGKELDPANLSEQKTALVEYIELNDSYRMSGTFEYGYKVNTTITTFETKIDMSYNYDHDIYKFTLKSKNRQGHEALKDEKLSPYHAPDGTYYIVKENDKTYVLSDVGGEKNIVDVSADSSLYNYLTGLNMKALVKTEFMNGKDDAEYSFNYHYKDGDYYHRTYPAVNYDLYVKKIEFKTYKDRPVKYEHCNRVQGSDVEFKYIVDYYYNLIPQDAPNVADWK